MTKRSSAPRHARRSPPAIPWPTAGNEIGRQRGRIVDTQAGEHQVAQIEGLQLILDDLGAQNTTPWAVEKLYQIIDFRYRLRLPQEWLNSNAHHFTVADLTAARHTCELKRRQEIIWQSLEPGRQDWSEECRTLAFILNGSVLEEEDDDFLVMLNGHRDQKLTFTVPAPPDPHRTRVWKKIISTGNVSPGDFVAEDAALTVAAGARVAVEPLACVVLQSKRR